MNRTGRRLKRRFRGAPRCGRPPPSHSPLGIGVIPWGTPARDGGPGALAPLAKAGGLV